MITKITAHSSTLTPMALMALQYLNGRRLRTALTTLAVVFGVAVNFSVNLVLPNAMAAFQRTMTGVSGAADISITSVTDESFMPQQPLQIVSGIKGVQAATSVLHRQITLPFVSKNALGTTPQIDLVGVDANTADAVRHFKVSDGRFLQPGDSGRAVLSPQLKVGSTFPLITAGGLARPTAKPIKRQLMCVKSSFQDVNVAAHPDLPDDVPCALGHFALQDVIAIFRHPDQVILNIVHRVRPRAVVLHAALHRPILPQLAKAIRLKAKVLDLPLGK